MNPMLAFSISDPVALALIAGAVTLGSLWINSRLKEIKKVSDVTHKLVNSGALIQFKLNAELSRWKADQGNNPDHIKAAEEAEKFYVEHKAKQDAIDKE